MKKYLYKKYQIKQLQKIKQSYKYIYIFRYDNITNNEIIKIKKNLNKLNLKILILKNFILNKKFLNLKLQGCIFILYNNNYINLKKILNIFKNFKLLLFKNNNNFYSHLKLKKILLNLNTNIHLKILNPLIYFLKIIKNLNINKNISL